MPRNDNRYSGLMIAIHWTTAVLVLVAYLVSESSEHFGQHPPVLHFACGLAVLALVAVRLLARASGGAPRPLEGGPSWLAMLAKLGHLTLYLLLIAVPLTGWYALSRLGRPIDLWGVSIPPIAAAVKGDIGEIGDVHQVGGNLLLILAGLHAAMGLWHQFVRRDHVLERMRPF
ncbi:MAG: cytochrome b [Gammaproteobacteria bacterium]|nr:cytochrome b [Gammaproteobacteria bacterium]